ncbi:MAG: orotidine-5'-phosphate decarboxylase [Bacteroidales bacterium]|nr:orotidine-5'-phosphate decarboxylase [Bacteroidales bacterium]
MTRQELIQLIRTRKSFLCVGLDPDLNKMPQHLLQGPDPVFQFNKAIIDATIDYTVAYKPNLAFYEAMGLDGLRQLKQTTDYLHSLSKPAFLIADAKRGDIGNTSKQYAKAFLDPEGDFNFDALTIAPYMGEDSVAPFLAYPNKWVILLALTSNKGAADFQFTESQGQRLFETVLQKSTEWGNEDNMMYVVGATKADMLTDVRRIVPNSFLLVPGVGAQGGSLQEVCRYGLNADCGLLVNSSRGIIYASNGTDFAQRAAEEARLLQQQMAQALNQ